MECGFVEGSEETKGVNLISLVLAPSIAIQDMSQRDRRSETGLRRSLMLLSSSAHLRCCGHRGAEAVRVSTGYVDAHVHLSIPLSKLTRRCPTFGQLFRKGEHRVRNFSGLFVTYAVTTYPAGLTLGILRVSWQSVSSRTTKPGLKYLPTGRYAGTSTA